MKILKKTIAALLAGILALASLFSCGGEKEGANIGDICYNFTLKKINSDGDDNVKNHRGKIVVVHFFGVWSGGLSQSLDTVASESSNDVSVLAVHTDHEKSKAPEFIEENFKDSKIIFLYDKRDGNNEDKYYSLLGGTDTYPRTLVLDKDGRITFVKEGDISYDELTAAIDAAK